MKKILIMAAAVGLLAMGRTAQATITTVIPSTTAYMTQGTGNQPELQVIYSVSFDSVSSLYTYSYAFTVGNLVSSVFTPTTLNPVTSFTVDTTFSLSIGNITSLNGGIATLYANNNITWNYGTAQNTDTVTYTSMFPPVLGGGSGNDGAPSVSWSVTNPGGSPIPIPAPVPEASTIMAGALMLLPLGIGAVRALRKERIA